MRLPFSWSTGLVALVLVAGCGSKVDSTAVAIVDGVPITGEQFRARYQRYLSSSSMKDNILVRKQVLENMINERLIFADLGASGADQDKEFKKELDVIRRQALADGYARRLTIDTMRITPAQMGEEFRRYNTKLTARYVYASTEEGARSTPAEVAFRGNVRAGCPRDVRGSGIGQQWRIARYLRLGGDGRAS